MRNKHRRRPRRGTADKAAVTLRKAIRKGKALCAVCHQHTADAFHDGAAICSRHLHAA